MAHHQSPLQSLQDGRWVKLICGASYQDMPSIRRLAMLYTLAGVDCIDVAADPAVIVAAQGGVEDARQIASLLGIDGHDLSVDKPWLMVSLNDSQDPHFRKAYFDAAHCPPTCSQPCEMVCPTTAIQFQSKELGGVVRDLCYGCGRCLSVCPVSNIEAHFHQADIHCLAHDQPLDAIEIHTHIGQHVAFANLWESLASLRHNLKAISVSCPDGPGLESYLKALYEIMSPLPVPLIWQTDGRPMSGDLGKGTTHAAIRLAQRVLRLNLPGYIQLAGGTNHYTVDKLAELNLIAPGSLIAPRESKAASGFKRQKAPIAGIAFGSYARKLVMPKLDAIDQEVQAYLHDNDIHPFNSANKHRPKPKDSPLIEGLKRAQALVGKLKNLPVQTYV